MYLTAPHNISDQETDESCGEIEVCLIPTQQYSNPTLAGNSSTQAEQLTALVSDPDTITEETVLGRSHEVTDIMSGLQALEVATQQEELEPLPGQSQVYPNQETVQDPTPTIKLEQQDEEIDIVGIEVTQNGKSENEVKEILVTQDNTVDLYVSPVAHDKNLPETQSSQLDTNSDKDPQEPVMTVTHSPDIKDEIDLTCLA